MFTLITFALISASASGMDSSSWTLSLEVGGTDASGLLSEFFPPIQPEKANTPNAVKMLNKAHKNLFIVVPSKTYIFNAAENSVPLKNFKEIALTTIKGRPEIMYIAYNTP